MSRPARLLAIFAHPDDEASTVAGTFALMSERGGAVTLVCATRGEVGEISDPALATPETLGSVREGELRSAMALVGVSDVRFLDYRDSGMAGTDDNRNPLAFMNADDEEVVGRLVEIMGETEPDVVITFGPEGVYGHPDHLKVHHAATGAVMRYGQRAERTGPALYYVAFPREPFLEMARQRPDLFDGLSEEMIATFGTPEASITTVIDVSAYVDAKVAAILAHRTQFRADGPWSELSEEMQREFLGTERFVHVPLPWTPPNTDPLIDLVTTTPEG